MSVMQNVYVPELILQPQTPDLYRRAHNALLAEINSIIPISAVKSIDELCCKLDKKDIKNPYKTAMDIKIALAQGVGEYITCSIGFAANRHLAKIACKMDKPNGVTVWHPNQMPCTIIRFTIRRHTRHRKPYGTAAFESRVYIQSKN
jgi:DNA polymerase-4